jgi:RNA polymerase sigma-70 factor (ECF subfamily)
MNSPDADALLVREAQAGSRTAFDMLVLKYQRRVERLLARSVRSPEDVAPSDDATPEALLASRQLAQGLNAAVEALAEDQRRALLLREVDGLSYDEIADLLDCPPGTVRSRIFRAREAVAARLRPLLGGGGGRRW